jgi:hypothetical protein
LLLHDKTIVLGAQGINPEGVGATAIMVRVDEDFEMIIQVLTHIAPEFRCDNPSGLGIMAIDSEVYSVRRVENAYFRLLGWQPTFVGFPLPKIGDRFG